MKTLLIVAHPHLVNSKVNSYWLTQFEKKGDVTIHSLYDCYKDEKIDKLVEQELLLAHDRIIFQFPLYWYSTPSLLKKWQDEVLEYGFAYGKQGNKLHGKELMLLISTGGAAASYHEDGANQYSVHQLMVPLEATARLCGMLFKPMVVFYGSQSATLEEIQESFKKIEAHLQDEADFING